MNKVIVIGSSGAGKSVFSRKLSEKTGLPLIHLDMAWHKLDKSHFHVMNSMNSYRDAFIKNVGLWMGIIQERMKQDLNTLILYSFSTIPWKHV